MAEQDDRDELTTVATFATRAEADLAQDRLKGEGVDAYVMDEMTAGVMPYLTGASGIRLQVPTEQLERAREALGLSNGSPEG